MIHIYTENKSFLAEILLQRQRAGWAVSSTGGAMLISESSINKDLEIFVLLFLLLHLHHHLVLHPPTVPLKLILQHERESPVTQHTACTLPVLHSNWLTGCQLTRHQTFVQTGKEGK